MRIDVISIFPEFFEGPLSCSLLKQARLKRKVEFHLHNPRDFSQDRHRTVDEKPFGGGPGMVLKPDPIFHCAEAIRGKSKWVVLLSPRGEKLTQILASHLARKKQLVLICGHYEGVDERVSKHLVDQEISVGDFVTMGGEAPALCLIESIIRLIPGVLGNPESLKAESFSFKKNEHSEKALEFPQYTRPRVFRKWEVPKVLLSGDHRAVEEWRKEQALRRTRRIRPDLLKVKKENRK